VLHDHGELGEVPVRLKKLVRVPKRAPAGGAQLLGGEAFGQLEIPRKARTWRNRELVCSEARPDARHALAPVVRPLTVYRRAGLVGVRHPGII